MESKKSTHEKSVLYVSNKGVEFVRTDYVTRSKVDVRNAGSGYTHRTYRFSNVPAFEHPYISWQNLNCCNGWGYDHNYLLKEAVQQHRKLVMEETLFGSFLAGMPEGLIVETLKFDPNETRVAFDEVVWWTERSENRRLMAARKGSLASFFDLKQIIAAYERLGVSFSHRQVDRLETLFQVELFDLFFAKSEYYQFSYANPETVGDLVITGLGLGYPVESTASIIQGY